MEPTKRPEWIEDEKALVEMEARLEAEMQKYQLLSPNKNAGGATFISSSSFDCYFLSSISSMNSKPFNFVGTTLPGLTLSGISPARKRIAIW